MFKVICIENSTNRWTVGKTYLARYRSYTSLEIADDKEEKKPRWIVSGKGCHYIEKGNRLLAKYLYRGKDQGMAMFIEERA